MESSAYHSVPHPLDALARSGLAVLPRYIDASLADALREEIHAARAAAGLRRARIGRGKGRRLADAIRGDWICWLDGSTEAQRQFLARLEEIRQEVNLALMLGLFEVEAH